MRGEHGNSEVGALLQSAESSGRPGVSKWGNHNWWIQLSHAFPNCRLAADGETVGYHAIREKQHVWKLHKCCNGGHHVGVQTHITKEETVCNARACGAQEGQKEAIYHNPDGARRPDTDHFATGLHPSSVLNIGLDGLSRCYKSEGEKDHSDGLRFKF